MTIRKKISTLRPLLGAATLSSRPRVASQKQIPKNMPTFGNQRLGKNFNGYIPGIHHPEYFPARNQTTGDLIGNSLAQFAGEAIGGLVESVGYVLDISSWAENWTEPGTKFDQFLKILNDPELSAAMGGAIGGAGAVDQIGEWLSSIARSGKEEVREELFPLYDTPRSSTMGNGRWVAQNLPSLGSFVGLLIPGAAAARGAGAMAKLANAGKGLSKTGQFLVQGAAGAAVSRHAEGMMEGYGQYDQYIKQGYSEEEAASIAAKVYRDNSALFAVDFLQFGYLMRPGGKVLRSLFSRSKDGRSLFQRAGETAFQAATEAGEEGFQFLAGEEAMAIQEGAKPAFLFAEGFLSRVDNYFHDTELYTSMLLGALGGAVAPTVIKQFNKIYKNPPEFSSEYLERMRSDVTEMLSEGEHKYLDGVQFLGNAMRHASQGRMSDMEDILKSYVDEYSGNAEKAGSVARAEEALEMIPAFEEVYNKQQNSVGYTRGDKFDIVKDPTEHIRALQVQEQFLLKMDEKLQEHYDQEYAAVMGETVGFDPVYEALYRARTMMDYIHQQTAAIARDGIEIPQDVLEIEKKYEDAYNAELARLEKENIPVSDINDKLTTTKDEALKKVIIDKTLHNDIMNQRVEKIKQIQTQEGQRAYLQEYDSVQGQRRENWMRVYGSYLGEGTKVGNEFSQFTVRQAKDPDRLHLERTDQLKNATPVSPEERKTFREKGTLTPERRIALANKKALNQRLNKIEDEMYKKHREEIDDVRKTNVDDNNGKGYSHDEMMKHLWNNGWELQDVTTFEVAMDEKIIALEQARLEGSRNDVLAKLQRTSAAIQGEQRYVDDNPGVSTDQLEELQSQLEELEARYEDIQEEYKNIENHPDLYRNSVELRRKQMQEAEEDVSFEQVSVDVSDRTMAGEEGRKKYAVDVYRTMTGVHNKKDAEGKWVQEVTDSASQRRFFKWVDSNNIHRQKLHIKLYPIVDGNGGVIAENLNRFVPADEDIRKGKTEEELAEIFADALFGVVVNEDGKPIGIDNKPIAQSQIPALGLFSSLIEPNLGKGEARVMAKEMDKIEGEFLRYRAGHSIIMELLRGTETVGATDVFLPVIAKSMGVPTDTGTSIPIAQVSPNPKNAHIIIGLPRKIKHQGRDIAFPQGQAHIRDNGNGTITKADRRRISREDEIETVYQLIMQGAADPNGYFSKIPKRSITYKDALRHYIHWMPPTRKGKGNKGGVIYDRRIADEMHLYLEGYDGTDGENFYKLDDLSEEDLKKWISQQYYHINQQWLEPEKRKATYSGRYMVWSTEKREFRHRNPTKKKNSEKGWKTYSEFLMDPKQGILTSTMPAWTASEEVPQRWNGNLIYSYSTDQIGKGSPFKGEASAPRPETAQKKGARTGVSRAAKKKYGRGQSALQQIATLIRKTAENVDKLTTAISGGRVKTRGGKGKSASASWKDKPSYPKKGRKKRASSAVVDISTRAEVKEAVANDPNILDSYQEWLEETGSEDTDKNLQMFSDLMGIGLSISGVELADTAEAVQETEEEVIDENEVEDSVEDPPTKENVSDAETYFREKSNEGDEEVIDRKVTYAEGGHYIPEDLAAAEEWFKERFPHVPFYIVAHLMKQGSMGRFTEWGDVLLDKAAEAGTIYHEAYHVTSFMYLTDRARKELYNEFRRKYGEKKMSDRQAEEGLAEMFRNYVLTGAIPESKPIKGFFAEFLEFIRGLLGKKNQILKTYERINNGHYAHLTKNKTEKFQYHDREIQFAFPDSDVQYTKEAIGHMHMLFLGEIRKLNLQTVVIEDGLTLKELKTIYDNVYEGMGRNATRQAIKAEKWQKIIAAELTKPEKERDNSPYQLRVMQGIMEEALTNAQKLSETLEYYYTNPIGNSWLQLHAHHMRAHRVELNEELIDEMGSLADNDAKWASEANQKSQFMTASTEVRFWLSGVYDLTLNDKGQDVATFTRNGFYRGMPDAFGRIAATLSGTTDIEEQVRRMDILQREFRGFKHVLRDFSLDSPNVSPPIQNLDANAFGRRSKFFQTFAKYYENYFTEMADPVKGNRRVATNNGTLRRQVFESWKRSYRKNLPDDVREKIINEEHLTFEDALVVAKKIGMDLQGIAAKSESQGYDLPIDLQEQVTKKLDFIARGLYVNPEYNPYEGETGEVNTLLRIEMRRRIEFSEASHINSSGNSVYDILDYNYYYYIVANLNQVADEINRMTDRQNVPISLHEGRELIYQRLPHFRHSYYATSTILDHIAEGNKIATALEEGIEGREYSKLRKPDRFVKEVLDLTRGVYHLVRPADNSLERVFSLATDEYGDTNHEFITQTQTEEEEVTINVLKDYLRDELAFLDEVNTKKAITYSNWEYFTENMRSDPGRSGMLMSMFSDPRFAPKVMAFLNSTGELEERQNLFVHDGQVTLQMYASVRYLVENQIQPLFAKYQVQELGLLGKELSALPVDVLARYVGVNYLISAMEQTKFLTGHPSQYASLDDMVKRMSGLVGPKTLSMTDARTNEYLESRFDSKGGGLHVAVTEDPIVTGSSVIVPKHGYIFSLPSLGAEYGITSDAKESGTNNRLLGFGKNGDTIGWISYDKTGKVVELTVTESGQTKRMYTLAGDYLADKGITLRSTGEEATVVWNSLVKEGRAKKAKKGYRYTPTVRELYDENTTINAYEESLVERFGPAYGKAKAELYKVIKESDAHGFWDMYTYREFLLRNGGWSSKQEMAWQWQMQGGWKGQKVTIAKNSPYTEIAGKVINRQDVEVNGHILVALKPQAFGPWKGSHMMTMLKFAATPLLPELIEGSALQDLAAKMREEGTGLNIMHTGTKVGTRVTELGTAFPLYDATGKVNSEKFITEELGWEHIGIQVQNSPTLKNIVSAGTQKEPQIMSDLHRFGVPIDFATSYREEFKSIPLLQAMDPLLIKDFPAHKQEKFYLNETDLKSGKSSQYEYDSIQDAYEDQIFTIEDAQKALNGTLDSSEYDILLGEIGMPQIQLGMQLLNDALYNISKIRGRLRLDKVAIGPIRDQIIPRANYSPEGIDTAAARKAWDALTEEEKLRKSGIYQMTAKIHRVEASNIDYGMLLAKEKLGLESIYNEEGTLIGYKIDDKKVKSAKNWLAREMGKRTKTPANMIEAIQWLDYGTDAMVNPQEVEVLLKSMITNSSTKRKVHGKGMVLVPATMQELQRKLYYAEGDKMYYKGSDLKTYQDNEGNVTSMEVYMPHYFKELYGTDVDINKIDPRLLEIIGFRIPTQALSSLESIKIKGFLPVSAGDIIIVPSELVVKTGADFDWDKLFVHLPNYDMVNDVPVYSEYEEVDIEKLWSLRKRKFALEYAPDAVIEIHNKYAEEGEQIDATEADFTEQLQDALLGTTREDNLRRNEEKEKELVELYSTLHTIWLELSIDQQNGHGRLDNLKLELQHQLIKMPARFGQLVSPITGSVGASVFKDIGTKLLTERIQREQELMGELAFGMHNQMRSGLLQLGNLAYMLKKGYELQTAKQNISVGALASVAHINYSQVNVYLDNFTTHIPTNIVSVEDYDHVSMAGTKDSLDKYFISDLLNELITAYADSPSDPFIHDIGGAGENAMVFATMLVMGTPVEYIVSMMNQPLIQWYNDKLDLQKSTYFSSTRKNEASEFEGSELMTKNFLTKYRTDYNAQYEPNAIQTTNRLWKEATLPYIVDASGEPMFQDKWDHNVQYTALKEYLKMKEAATDFLKHITASTYNTQHGGKSILSAKLLVKATDTLINRPDDQLRFVNYNKLFEKGGFLYPHRKAVKETIAMLTPFHAFMNNSSVHTMIDDLMGKMVTSQDGNTMEDNIRTLDRFRNELGTAIYQTQFSEQNLWDTHRELIMTYPTNETRKPNDTVPRRVLRMKNEMKAGTRAENFLIMNLVPSLKNKTEVRKVFVDSMSLQTISGRKANAMEQDRFTDAWRELYNMEPQLATDLFVFVMMQSGLSPSPNNFIRVAPNEMFADHYEVGMISKLQKMMPNPDLGQVETSNMVWFYEQFALNNRDNRIFRWAGRRKVSTFDWPFMQKTDGNRKTYFVNGKRMNTGSEKVKVKQGKKEITETVITWKGYPFADYTTFASLKRYQEGDTVITKREAKEESMGKVARKTKPRRKRRSEMIKAKAGTPKPVVTVISGGQTGADQIGLRAARDAGMLTGGTAPKGYYTEAGANEELRDVYGLEEGKVTGYKERTKLNVMNADATVLFGDMESPGSKQTLDFLRYAGKPYSINPTSEQLDAFIQEHGVSILNVAGNRSSKLTKAQQSRIYDTVYQALLRCK